MSPAIVGDRVGIGLDPVGAAAGVASPAPAANEAVDRGECEPVRMLEVAVPAAQGRIESRNDVSDGIPFVTLASWRGCYRARTSDFRAYPPLPCFKPVPQKLEPLTLDTAIPNMGFVRMERQSVRTHPSTHAGQRSSASSRLRHNTTASSA